MRVLALWLVVGCAQHHGGGNGLTVDGSGGGDGSGSGSGSGGGDGSGSGSGSLSLPDPCTGYTGIQHGAWPMAARCPSRAGQAASNGPHAVLQGWQHPSAGRYGSSVAIAEDGTIYVPDLDLHALDSGGTEKWFYAIGQVVGSPTIGADGTIYVGSNDQYVYAIAPDGKLVWRTAMSEVVETSPAIANDGTIYVTTYNSIAALEPTGAIRWSITRNTELRSPAIAADGTLYIANDTALYAFAPSGTGKFTYPLGGSIEGAPVLGPDGTAYITSNSDTASLAAVHPDGTLAWGKSLAAGEVFGWLAVAGDGTVLATTSQSRLFAFTPAGTQLWQVTLGGLGRSPVISRDGIVYVTWASGEHSGGIDAVSLVDGSPVWSWTEPDAMSCEPAFTGTGQVLAGFNAVYTFDP